MLGGGGFSRLDDGVSGYACGFGCVFQAEDGIRYLVRARGLGDVYKRQAPVAGGHAQPGIVARGSAGGLARTGRGSRGALGLSLIHI